MITRTMLAAAATILIATTAHAHPKLLKSTPAEGATAAAPTAITLQFSEKLITRFSGVELTMTSMPGTANHPAMKLDGLATSFGPDGKTLIATPAKALVPGGYRIDWHAVAGDNLADKARAKGIRVWRFDKDGA